MKLKELYQNNIQSVDRIDKDCEKDFTKYASYKNDLLELLDDTGMAICHTGTDLFLSELASNIAGNSPTYIKRWLVRMGLWTATKIAVEQCECGYIYKYIIPHKSGVTRWNILAVQYLPNKERTAVMVNYSTTLNYNKVLEILR